MDEQGNPERRRKWVPWLAAAWLVILLAYLSWGAATGRGLYGWLAALSVERGGSYSGKLNFLLPFAVLGGPAIWYLSGWFQCVEAKAARSPEAQRRYGMRWAKGLLGVAGLAGAAGLVALLIGLGMPDGREAPAPITLADLERGAIPEGKVRISGRLDPRVRAEGTETRRRIRSEERMFYIGFRPAEGNGAALPAVASAPFRLFIDSGLPNDPVAIAAYPPDSEGYLRANALPDFARRAFARQGITIASPHYVLDLRPGARALPYQTGALVGFGLALIFGLVGGLVMASANGRLRRPFTRSR